jgi:transcriptional regulator with XRE-family HTH domain
MFEGLRVVRKRAGISQAELARRIGTRQSNIAAYENGAKGMSEKLASRVLKALDEDDSPSSVDLVIANRIKAFQQAKKKGDLERMFDSATAVVKAGAATPGALPLFHEMIEEIEAEIDEADGLDTDDDRDLYGRVRPVLKGSDDEDDRDLYGRVVAKPSGDDEDDGRDMFGRVIRPVDQDDDDDEEEYEDDDDLDGIEEDNRDIYGRKIR